MNRQTVTAPTVLSAATRAAFYDDALAALQQLEPGRPGQLIIDLRITNHVDSSALSTLLMLQVRAAEQRHSVGLLGASEEVRFLLLMTRLEDRFDFHPEV